MVVKTKVIKKTKQSKDISPKKPTVTKAKKLAKVIEDAIERLFFEGNLTPTAAARKLNIDYKTLVSRWSEIAATIVREEDYEPFHIREAKARKRAIEGYSSKLEEVLTNKEILDKKWAGLHPKLGQDEITDNQILKVEAALRQNIILTTELQQQINTIEMAPPMDEVLQAEIEKRVDEQLSADTDTPVKKLQNIARKYAE